MFSTRYQRVLKIQVTMCFNTAPENKHGKRKEANMNLKPLGDRVIIKQDEAETTTASGLFIASETKEKPQTGTVLAVGAGKLDKDGNRIEIPVQVGDRVVYSKYGGTEITSDDEDVLIVRADDIFAVFA
jgi:chaperonin GroES